MQQKHHEQHQSSHNPVADEQSPTAAESRREWFDLLVEQHEDGVMVFESMRDRSGSIVDFRWLFANESAASIVGKPRDWFKGRELLKEMPENRESGLFDNYVLVVETGEPISLEFTYPINGEERYFRNRSVRVNDGFAVFFSDETQARRLEKARLEEQHRLLTSLDAAQASAFDWNLLTDEVTWRTGDYRLLNLPVGQEPTSLSGWMDYVHAEDREGLTKSVEQAIAEKGRFVSEYRVVWDDGSVHWMLGVGSVEVNDGRATRMFGTLSDITIRKQAELEKQASEDLFRSFANTIPQLAWVASASGQNTWFNEQWIEFTGMTFGPESANSWLDCVAPGESATVANQWHHALQAGTEIEITHDIRQVTGVYRPFLTRARPVRNASGTLTRWVGTSTEISDLQETQRLLKEADQEKDKFLATLAHELRNPLAPIRNAIELLDTKIEVEKDAKQTTTVLKRQVNQMVRLVDDLLDINRIKFGRISLEKESVCLESVIDEALENINPIATEMRHELKAEIPKEVPVIIGDHLRLVQALNNLLHNACKFMAPGGLIELKLECFQNEIELSVTDHGMGLAKADSDGIFEMFVQAKGGVGKTDGLGIGLALSKSLVEMHGGRLLVSSAGIGKGSKFSMFLPRPVVEQKRLVNPFGKSEPGQAAQATAGKSILIVDDNDDAADSLAWILEAEGHRIQVVSSGKAALLALDQEQIDTLILDIGLPDISGYEVARTIRARENASQYQLIALSGWGQPSDREQSTQAGFDAHLVKPANLPALRQLINSPQAKAKNPSV